MDKIEVLALAGSPRKGGNSDILLESVLDGVRSVLPVSLKKFYLNTVKLVPCQACGGCEKTGICTVQDDMQEIYQSLMKLSIIVVSSPIYFNSISAQLKAVIDRCQAHWYSNFILGEFCSKTSWPRKGIFLSTRGQKGQEIFKYSEKIIKAFLKNENIDYSGSYFVDSVDEKGSVKAFPQCLEECFLLGKKTAESFVSP